MAGTRQFSEDALLEHALSLFWQKGYRATSMIDIAKATGIQRGSLYNAYDNKTTLFLKAFENYATQLLTEIDSHLTNTDLKTALYDMFDFLVTRLCDGTQRKGCLSTRAIMEASEDDDKIKQQLMGLLNSIEERLTQRMKQAQQQGNFHGNCSQTARYLVALSRGLAVLERVYTDPKHLHEICCTAIEMLPIRER